MKKRRYPLLVSLGILTVLLSTTALASDTLTLSISEPLYDWEDFILDSHPTDPLTVFKEEGKYGFHDGDGNLIIPATYADFTHFQEGFAGVMNDENLWGVIDETGAFIVEPQYAEFRSFCEGMAAVKATSDDGGWGFIDTTGTLVIPTVYASVGDFSEGLAAACRPYDVWEEFGGYCGYLHIDGTAMTEVWTYRRADDFSNGLALVGVYNQEVYEEYYIDTEGNPVEANPWDQLDEGIVGVWQEDYSCDYYDAQGNFLFKTYPGITSSYTINELSEGYAFGFYFYPAPFLIMNDSWEIVAEFWRTSSEEWTILNCDPLSDGLFRTTYVTYASRYYIDVENIYYYAFLDSGANVILSGDFLTATPFEDGAAYVETADGFYVIANPLALQIEEETEEVEEVTPSNVPSDWALEEVTAALDANLVPELTDSPRYTDALTRLQFAQLIVNTVEQITGEIVPADSDTFTDTDSEAVLKAYATGIINGMTETTFQPDTTTNREQIATMISRAIDYMETETGVNLAPVVGNLTAFTDATEVSSWAVDAVARLATNGIMNGTSTTTLSPQDTTSVEMSILLCYRLYILA